MNVDEGSEPKHKTHLTCFQASKQKNNPKQTSLKKPWDYSLYLLGIFVANEYDDWVDVNAVKTFDGVRGNVK